MKFSCGISLILWLLLSCSDGARTRNEPSRAAGKHASRVSSAAFSENPGFPGDSIVQRYSSVGYSIHIMAKVIGPGPVLFPEHMWMIIDNSHGRTTLSSDQTWHPDLTGGLFSLEPEWPDYFLVHEHNTGNCCTCDADYLLKITADEIKVIGLVNDYKDGRFYVNICDWPVNKAHVEMTLEKHEVPLINDTLRYPANYNI